MATLEHLNAEQIFTLVFVFANMAVGGMLMAGRVALRMEG